MNLDNNLINKVEINNNKNYLPLNLQNHNINLTKQKQFKMTMENTKCKINELSKQPRQLFRVNIVLDYVNFVLLYQMRRTNIDVLENSKISWKLMKLPFREIAGHSVIKNI